MDCYFCKTKTSNFTFKSRQQLKYPDIPTISKTIPHSEQIPVPVYRAVSSMSGSSVDLPCSSNARSEFVFDVSESKKFDQAELNDLARDFGLSKKSSEIFASREKNLLSLKTKISYFRTRDAEFQQYFTILGLLKQLRKDNYDLTEWRLFSVH